MLAKTKMPRQKGITLLLEYNWTLTILVFHSHSFIFFSKTIKVLLFIIFEDYKLVFFLNFFLISILKTKTDKWDNFIITLEIYIHIYTHQRRQSWAIKLHLIFFLLDVNFDKFTVRLHFLFIYSMFVKFSEDQILIVMSSIKYLNFKFL